eukprot:746885-Hanusia_phi.AAC.1
MPLHALKEFKFKFYNLHRPTAGRLDSAASGIQRPVANHEYFSSLPGDLARADAAGAARSPASRGTGAG